MGGSGGGGGKNSWPGYMDVMFHQWLNNFEDDPPDRPWADNLFPDIATTMKNATTAVGGNPYDGAVAYNPDFDVLNIQDSIDALNDDISGGWAAFLTDTIAGIDGTISSPSDFDGMLNTIETRFRREYNKSISTFNAPMLEISAIMTSTYHMKLAQTEQDLRDRVNTYMVNQEESTRQMRINLLNSMGIPRLDARRAHVELQRNASQVTILAKADEDDTNQSWVNSKATWDLDIFQYNANMLASISGATQIVQKQTPLQRSLAALANGASAGLSVIAANPASGAAAAGTVASTGFAQSGVPLGVAAGQGAGGTALTSGGTAAGTAVGTGTTASTAAGGGAVGAGATGAASGGAAAAGGGSTVGGAALSGAGAGSGGGPYVAAAAAVVAATAAFFASS